MAFLASGSEHTMTAYLHEPIYNLNLRPTKIGIQPRSGIEACSEWQRIDKHSFAG